ncbi:MAG: FtsX-like permease family protein [Chloroflexota bacterium]
MNVRGRKVARDLLASKSRSLLVVLAVAVGVAAFGLMLTGRIVLEQNLRDGYAATNPAQASLSFESFDATALKYVRERDYVAAAEAERIDLARTRGGGEGDTWLGFEIHTLSEFNSLTINRLTMEGGTLTAPALHSILIEGSLRNLVEVGSTLTIELLNGKSYTLTVAGFVNDLSRLPSDISLTGVGFISKDTARELGLGGFYNQLNVRYKSATTRSEIEKQTTKLTKDLESQNQFVLLTSIPAPDKYILGDNMTSVLLILGSIGALTLILSGFLVTSVMSAVMAQQVPQIGILKSLGGRLHQTVALYFQEVIVFGLLALALAIPLGYLGAFYLADGMAAGMNFNVERFYLPPITLILQAFSALFIPLLASLVPILSGSRITIREAIANYKPETGSRIALGGLPQLANLSIRNTFRRKGRLLLTFVALVLAGSMFIAIVGIRGSMRQALSELDAESAYDVGVDFSRPYSQTDLKAEALKVSGVRAVEAWLVDSGFLVFDKDHWSGGIIVTGVPANTTMTRPAVIHGAWLDPKTKRGMFVNADFMDLSPDMHVGSVVKLNIAGVEKEWTILGSGGRGFIPAVYVHYDDLVEQNQMGGYANRIVLQTNLPDPAYQSRVESVALARFDKAKFEATGSQTTTESKETNAAQMDILIVLLLAMVALISVVGGLGLAIMMSLNVIERTREIGVLRSIGARNGVVRRVVVTEGLAIGVISWALSIPFSIPLAVWLGDSLGNSMLSRPLDYAFSWNALGMWLGIVVVISIIASIVPAQTAARLTIREALAYE